MAILFLVIMGVFATVILAAYAFVPQKYRYIVLLVASLAANFIYSHFMGFFIVVTIITIYCAGLWIEKTNLKYLSNIKDLPKEEKRTIKRMVKRKNHGIMILAIIINLLILLVLKYANFFTSISADILSLFHVETHFPLLKIMLPIGISYYTLQAMSYVIDVANGKYTAEQNPLKVALFISFFPQLYEGPFGRYDEMKAELTSGRNIESQNILSGWLSILWGLFKVLIVSNRFAMIAGEVFKNHQQYGGWIVLLGVVAFTIQLYAEFSGYIDIASGVSRMFGIHLRQNFDAPFLSKSVGEFWRRWHISLGSWFRDYIFFPISMSDGSMKLRSKWGKFGEICAFMLAIFAVWSLTGLWHGASMKYLVYGLYYFGLMLLYEWWHPLATKFWHALRISENNVLVSALRICTTFALVCLGMLIFRAENLQVCGEMVASLVSSTVGQLQIFDLLEVDELVIMIIGFIVLILAGIPWIRKRNLKERIMRQSFFVKYVIIAIIVLFIMIFGAYGNGYLPPDPVYGGF